MITDIITTVIIIIIIITIVYTGTDIWYERVINQNGSTSEGNALQHDP